MSSDRSIALAAAPGLPLITLTELLSTLLLPGEVLEIRRLSVDGRDSWDSDGEEIFPYLMRIISTPGGG